MEEEDVTDKNRQERNFRRINTFRKNEPILLVTFGQIYVRPRKLFWFSTAMLQPIVFI